MADYPPGRYTHTRHQRDFDDRETDDRNEYPSHGFYPPQPPPSFAGHNEFPSSPPRGPPSFHGRSELPSSPPRGPPSVHGRSEFEQRPPPPGPYGGYRNEFEQRLPSSGQYSGYPSHDYQESRPPPRASHSYSSNPPIPQQHFSSDEDQATVINHSHRPHLPSFLHPHQSKEEPLSGLSSKRICKIYCKTDPNFSLAIRDGKVILARSNSSDETQQWYKDEKFSTKVKDQEGFPCFSLVNKATGQAIKHSVGATHPVQLIPYTTDKLDQSILWTASKDLGDGYRTIRMVNNIKLNMDAYHGDKKSGGVHDGTIIVLWEWAKGDNQRWIIAPN